MKKSLVALAVLAASGAVLAQVTVKGNLTSGYKAVTSGAVNALDGGVGVGSSGFGVDTADLTFSASEDLGGGMKAGASMGLVNVVRGAGTAAVTPGFNGQWAGNFGPANNSLFVSGNFGKVTLATARGSDYLTGGVAFVGGTYQDGRTLSTRDASDSIAWSMPVGPVAVSLTYSEPNNYLGLGAGTSGANSSGRVSVANPFSTVTTPINPSTVSLQSNVAIGVRYTDGPLVGDFGYAMYDEGDTPTNQGDKSDTRFAGSYDLGVAKIGGGWRQRAGKIGERTDMGLSAAVPMGALTLGANWVQRSMNNYGGNNNIAVGYGLGANYALSKRTSFIADYTAYTTTASTTVLTGVYNLLLSHSF